MDFWRKHWFDIGGVLAVVLGAWLAGHYQSLTTLQLVLWLNFIALLLHQVEEYRWPGYFPGMINQAVYRSTQPDRFPLNTRTSLVINVVEGWLCYGLAVWLGPRWPWLGIAAALISAGNIVVHTVVFNIKGKTWYNPGMATALGLFLPLVIWFTQVLRCQHLATASDWVVGLGAGLFLNVLGIVKLIDWLADPQTAFRFEQRQLLPQD